MKLANLRAKEAILRVARGKRILKYKGKNIRIMSDLSRDLVSQKGLTRYIKSTK